MACKVDSNLVKQWITHSGADPEKKMHSERMRYAVQKDELVMNVSQKMFRPHENVAYPLVLSNVSELNNETKKLLFALYASQTYDEFVTCAGLLKVFAHNSTANEFVVSDELAAFVQRTLGVLVTAAEYTKVAFFPFFRAQGYAQGTGYASHISGDTVCTVMIGGMATVMNGAFTMHAGDLIQWYFNGEEECYHPNSSADAVAGERSTLQQRNAHKRRKAQQYHDQRAYGMQAINEQHKSKAVFRIKPYRMSKGRGDNDEYVDYFGDKSRVFAKCIGGGKPYEMVDVMLMTQSL